MSSLIGITCVLIYLTLAAGSAVFLSSFLLRTDTLVVLFAVFLIIAVFFNVLLLSRKGFSFRIDRSAWRPLLFVNVMTAASWSSFFFAIQYIEPALSSSIVNAILPLTTIVVDTLLLKRRASGFAEVAMALALCGAMLFTAAVLFGGHSGGPAKDVLSYTIGFSMSVVCGISLSCTNVASKKLNMLGVSPSEIMAYRFTLLILLAGAFASKEVIVVDILAYWPQILMVAIVGNLVPIFALQVGIQRLKPVTVAFLIGLAPIIFFFMQGLNSDIQFSWPTLACTVVTTIIIIAGTRVSMMRDKKKQAVADGSASQASEA